MAGSYGLSQDEYISVREKQENYKDVSPGTGLCQNKPEGTALALRPDLLLSYRLWGLLQGHGVRVLSERDLGK